MSATSVPRESVPQSANPGVTPAIRPCRHIDADDPQELVEREWLVTNGLGGYSSGTISGVATRRYHGLLIAAMPAPVGRVMLFNHLTEHLQFGDGGKFNVGGVQRLGGVLDVAGVTELEEFRLEMGLPVWRFSGSRHVIEKRIYMPHHRNTVHINYRLVSGEGEVRLQLRPSLHFRGHDQHVATSDSVPYTILAKGGCYEFCHDQSQFPRLRMQVTGRQVSLTLADAILTNILYRIEECRGYDNVGTLWNPGMISATLTRDSEVTLTASAESWDEIHSASPQAVWATEMERRQRLLAMSPPASRSTFGAELTLAADQFIILPASRIADSARAQASGDQARSVIAGYHWFTDWGRDTMISLEGLTLVTGRHSEAGYILRTFAHHVRDGLIPNFFPDHDTEGVYHTADATLWFFHALHRYVVTTGDFETVRDLLPTLREIISRHHGGTRFGIGVDPRDGLLKQGADGYQLTWMDAKVGNWVVTPRRGKAVEINALWYNAIRLLEGWLQAVGEPTDELDFMASQVYEAFNDRFWCEAQRGLYDVVDGENGDDDSCRPNQIFAISLDHPVLDPARWPRVMETVSERLVTPIGLRTLAPGHPDYKPKYSGDLTSRDAAYHQGTVWAWLIGPFIDAWRRTYPDRHHECQGFLSGVEAHLSEACIGTISEIFDAEAPYSPRGCAAQAWSVAEVLRAADLIGMT